MTTYKLAFTASREVVNMIKSGFSYYRRWRQRERDLRHLSELPDYLLDDIGLDQNIVDAELRKSLTDGKEIRRQVFRRSGG
ncbi:DUF1127 domain-containing protein [Photobacterium sp. WH77]|uniref:DUF1127 domain-containing protein n=2 Tax=Vibrionaceae TaxID=641 RepID=A0ABR9BTM3_9GAMM|nr:MULTISPECIES: DUF1127 domain-containing protein [Photobacterium]MBD8515106.1 DUF1127 domain-containing protein [Photobacterium arenosum]MBV7263386.1 DUF1127 domain-containing protein [Photobacterium sp. WH24]MCG2838046.1 DUF1127 domain-containing protein [Photobacterium sp. WH77]MCG2845664.1 DUF1127 domain-containing protein [Photobacterium sp. WH80]